ncbi:MAG TPA: aldolase/citrate lyase family protein, partial [Candidatus Acidoferrum sp.]|nr:aldolase/citrate lyase family protein [Candidatus Acidoferrum sp.]
PEGRRGVNPFVRAADFTAGPDWFEQTNRAIAVMAMIEGREGIQALPEILEVPHLDAVFLGPVDLSQSLGLGLQPEHPRVIETVSAVVQAASEKGKGTAVFAPNAAAARRWLERGVGFVAVSEDTAIIAAAFKELLAEVKGKEG